ncbi:MAG: hypothetical protein ABJK89_07625, partial [Paracoccaceae bacterium]
MYDLRKEDESFSFLSTVGLIVLFLTIFATGYVGEWEATNNCSIENIIFSLIDCTNTWLALVKLLSVIAVSYLIAMMVS